MRVLLREEDGAGATIIEETVDAGIEPPSHAHLHHSETFYVVEGSYTFFRDDEVIEATAGDLVSIPPGVTHGWTAGPDGGKSLIVFVPGGMEGYFEELAAAFVASGGGPLPEEFFADTLNRYGMEMRRG